MGIAHAVPSHCLPQDLVLLNARKILGPRFPEFERLSKSFLAAGIERRYSVVPFEWFSQPQDFEKRNAAYSQGALKLFQEAAVGALHASGLEAEDVDCIVTVSSTGIATPTLEACSLNNLGFRRDVARVPVFGLGCAGGVTGLSLAARLARASPASVVLLVAVETCTLSFRTDQLRKADIIATALFGDGAAACCLSTGGKNGPRLGAGVEYTWPDTLNIMGWKVENEGLGVIFDRSIPGFVQNEFRNAFDQSLSRLQLGGDGPDHFLCHPGGVKVLEALETALGVPAVTLKHERDVLRDYGNMSAPTALFVLERAMQDKAFSGMALMAALGPGFTASFQVLDFSNTSKTP